MLNQNPKAYFNQVAMIESQYESKRRNIQTPGSSLLQNRSPLRDRESNFYFMKDANSINTPSRLLPNPNKTSLSPIRSRRQEQTMASVRSTASNVISRKKSNENYCENHPGKVAKFVIDKENEQFYFCDRCAIPLISNGFKLTKIGDDNDRQTENPRISEINQFLKHLETMGSGLSRKKQSVSTVMSQGKNELDSELEKIEQFYSQLYQIIEEHKRRVVEEMKTEFEKSSKGVKNVYDKVEEALKDSTNMKEDILTSMNSVILEVMDHEFRSVMNQYYSNLESFRQICTAKCDDTIKMRTLSFKDSETVCQNLIQGLIVEWNDEVEEAEEQPKAASQSNSLLGDYQYRTRGREEQESDRQNPIECLDTEERKPCAKDIGLFCSFDE